MHVSRQVLGSLFATLALACSSSDAASGVNEVDLTSDSGALRVVVSSEPDTLPVRGLNQIYFDVRSSDSGQALDDLELSMTALMPSHSHGSPDVPPATALGGGRYRFDNVVLSMPGLWEFRTTVTGPLEDHVTPRFEVE